MSFGTPSTSPNNNSSSNGGLVQTLFGNSNSAQNQASQLAQKLMQMGQPTELATPQGSQTYGGTQISPLLAQLTGLLQMQRLFGSNSPQLGGMLGQTNLGGLLGSS